MPSAETLLCLLIDVQGDSQHRNKASATASSRVTRSGRPLGSARAMLPPAKRHRPDKATDQPLPGQKKAGPGRREPKPMASRSLGRSASLTSLQQQLRRRREQLCFEWQHQLQDHRRAAGSLRRICALSDHARLHIKDKVCRHLLLCSPALLCSLSLPDQLATYCCAAPALMWRECRSRCSGAAMRMGFRPLTMAPLPNGCSEQSRSSNREAILLPWWAPANPR